MLDSADSQIVAKWLKEAMAKRKATLAALAEHCGVRPQAVYGWLKTGRITKSNLAAASAFLRTPPPFTDTPATTTALRAAERDGVYHAHGWPFAMVDEALLARCARADINRLEGALIATAHALGLDIVRRPA